MTSLKDLLQWYNLLDVTPLLAAVTKQFDQIKTNFKLDMFKRAITLPGLSLLYALSTTGARFEYFGERFSDIYKELRNNVVGGASTVFTRYHEKGKTVLRGDEFGDAAQGCEKIEGYDANSLYLYCLGMEMPTGGVSCALWSRV